MPSASRKFRLAEFALTTVLLVGSSAVKLSHAQAANPGMSESPVHGRSLPKPIAPPATAWTAMSKDGIG